MDKRPIGVFDSGLGGLTTVRELKNILPNEDIVYFGDTSRVPYGTRSHETIKKYAKQDINFLLKHNVKMVIAACNTASAIITGDIINDLGVEYTGVLSPAVHSAIKTTKNGKIGVIGTPATIRSGAYGNALRNLDKNLDIFGVACPLFVPLVENGFTQRDNQITRLVAEQYLNDLISRDIDTLILGCTHYPIIGSIISDVMGNKVNLIDSGQEAARYAKQVLTRNNMLNTKKTEGNYSYFVSDSVESFAESASVILGEPFECKNKLNVEKIDIEVY